MAGIGESRATPPPCPICARLLARQSAANTFKAVSEEYVARHGGRWGKGYGGGSLPSWPATSTRTLAILPIASLRLAHILPLFAKIELRGSLTVVHAAEASSAASSVRRRHREDRTGPHVGSAARRNW